MKKKDNIPTYIILTGFLPFIIPILAGIYKVTIESWNMRWTGIVLKLNGRTNDMEKAIPLGRAKNLAGKKFGRLTAIERVSPINPNSAFGVWWRCQCVPCIDGR